MRKTKPTDTPLADERLIGSWAIEGGDYPLIDEYRHDGTVVQRLGETCRAPIPFRVEGELLTFLVEQPDGSIFEQTTRFAISADTLTFFDSPQRKRVFRRIRTA